MPRPSRCARRVRANLPWFVECTSVCMQRTRAHRARAPAGVSVRPRRGKRGPRSQARSTADRWQPCLRGRSTMPSTHLPSPLADLQPARGSLIFDPFALRRPRLQCPKGRRDGSRRFRCRHKDVPSAEHRPRTRTFRRSRKAQCQGVLSFGDFSLHAQRKVTRSPKGRVKAPFIS